MHAACNNNKFVRKMYVHTIHIYMNVYILYIQSVCCLFLLECAATLKSDLDHLRQTVIRLFRISLLYCTYAADMPTVAKLPWNILPRTTNETEEKIKRKTTNIGISKATTTAHTAQWYFVFCFCFFSERNIIRIWAPIATREESENRHL